LSLKNITPVLSFILFLLFLNCGKKTEQNQPAPPFDFSLPDLNGKTHTLKEFKGKVVFLNFWATWCPACKEDITTLKILNREYKNSGLEIIGISLDKKGLGEVDSFVQHMKIPYTVLLGDESVVKSYGGIKGVPTSFLLDKEGRIIKKYSGQINHETVSSDLKTLFGE
jgi:cytochrome c biogenesis protein CcmG/thiol:disulfide interchange protein DsbE